MRKPSSLPTLIIGIGFIIAGIGFLLQQLTVFEFSRFWAIIWPLLALVLAVFILVQNWRAIFPAAIFGFVGIAGLLSGLNIYSDPWRLWPVLIIALGISIILDYNIWGNTKGSTSHEDSLNELTMFWALEKQVTSKNFLGGVLTIIFGGAEINLAEVKLADNAQLSTTVMFGGLDLRVPKDVKIVNKTIGIFGGSEDRTSPETDAKTLVITGVVMFGGLEIRNT